MSDGAINLSEREIRRGIFEQYEAKLPRPGSELDAFIAAQCDYFGIDDRLCRRVVANAQTAHTAIARSETITAAQRVAATLNVSHVDVIEKTKSLMDARRRKAALDRSGNAIKDADGNPVWEEVDDLRVQLAATDQMAKILGTYAPKQVHLEATHEHNVNISDDELRGQFAALAPFLGIQVVDAEFAVVAGGAAPGDSDAAGDATQSR